MSIPLFSAYEVEEIIRKENPKPSAALFLRLAATTKQTRRATLDMLETLVAADPSNVSFTVQRRMLVLKHELHGGATCHPLEDLVLIGELADLVDSGNTKEKLIRVFNMCIRTNVYLPGVACLWLEELHDAIDMCGDPRASGWKTKIRERIAELQR
jgi:hypothetical protein